MDLYITHIHKGDGIMENEVMENEIENIEQNEVEKKKKKGVKRTITIIVLILLLLLGMRSCSRQQEFENGNVSGYMVGEGFAPTLSAEDLQAMMQEKIDKSSVSFSVFSEPKFKNGKGNIMFGNPRYSAHDLTLEVKVGNNTVIKTDKLSPNHYIGEIELMKSLKKGTHKGEGLITAYDLETGEVAGEVVVEMIITVK